MPFLCRRGWFRHSDAVGLPCWIAPGYFRLGLRDGTTRASIGHGWGLSAGTFRESSVRVGRRVC